MSEFHDDDYSGSTGEDVLVFYDNEEESAAKEHVESAPIISSYNDKIRPLLDAIDQLRRLMVMKQGIQLPTIVVVGDQSSGKSSVLESLASINLPRGQGICTRVPLIIRLQKNENQTPEIYLEYNGKVVQVDETQIATSINLATDEVAGYGKGISNNPITLVVKKQGIPDLTMVDLPGITRVPVHGQPENIYEQIRDIIMHYITPKESIILNVLSATVDFSTCESIRMSQMVDRKGKRTLAVVTKSDRATEELLEKVTADDVNIGLGYVCVRNRIGDETFEEARMEESRLFQNHPYLSGIDKSMVGIPVLARKLVRTQASIIAKCLPVIVKNINEKLNENVAELARMPKALTSTAEALQAFMRIMGAAKESLRKLLLRGEFDEYFDDNTKHGTARLFEMLNKFTYELHNCIEPEPINQFLTEEIKVLEDAKGIELPNFLPREAFLRILHRKVEKISAKPVQFVEKFWGYIEEVVTTVLMDQSEMYYQLKASTKRAAHILIQKIKNQSLDRVKEIVQMEKKTAYTCNPDYMLGWTKLMSQEDKFIKTVKNGSATNQTCLGSNKVKLEGFGDVGVEHLRQNPNDLLVTQAFDLKMRMAAYWKIVVWRLVDSMTLYLQFRIHNLVNNEMEEIVSDLVGSDGHGIERMFVESPAIVGKREKLKKSIEVLKEAKDVVAGIMDKIASYDVN